MTLMLNELATNALKHGALKSESGHIDFSWLKGEDDLVSFRWKETSPVQSLLPSLHKGFGSQILTRIVPLDFQGEAQQKILPEGLLYTVSARRERVWGAE